jgi:hypothetical protein
MSKLHEKVAVITGGTTGIPVSRRPSDGVCMQRSLSPRLKLDTTPGPMWGQGADIA